MTQYPEGSCWEEWEESVLFEQSLPTRCMLFPRGAACLAITEYAMINKYPNSCTSAACDWLSLVSQKEHTKLGMIDHEDPMREKKQTCHIVKADKKGQGLRLLELTGTLLTPKHMKGWCWVVANDKLREEKCVKFRRGGGGLHELVLGGSG